jgi:hypothetical protein
MQKLEFIRAGKGVDLTLTWRVRSKYSVNLLVSILAGGGTNLLTILFSLVSDMGCSPVTYNIL